MSKSENIYELVDSTDVDDFPFETDVETLRQLNEVLPTQYNLLLNPTDGVRVETYKYLGEVEVNEL